MEQQPDWVEQVSKAIPGVIAAGLVGICALLWQQTSTARLQSDQLAEMSKTLKMVCDQLAEKGAVDAVQTERIQSLRLDVDSLMRR